MTWETVIATALFIGVVASWAVAPMFTAKKVAIKKARSAEKVLAGSNASEPVRA